MRYDDILISVVIPTYNRPHMLKNAIESVCNQTHQSIELIVIDDCSMPRVHIESYNTEKLKRAMFVRNNINMGCGASLHKGFSLATGKYICYLGDDDLWPGDKLSIQVIKMMDDDLDWSYFSKMVSADESLLHHKIIRPSYIPHMAVLNGLFAKHPYLRFLAVLNRNPINSSSIMIRRDVYERHGGWDERTMNADCDGNLILNYSLLKLKCDAIDAIGVIYRNHEHQVSKRATMAPGKEYVRSNAIHSVMQSNEYPFWFKMATRLLG